MKILKMFGIVALYIILIFVYLISGLYRNFNENFLLSVAIIGILAIITIKYIVDMIKKGDNNKFKIIKGVSNLLFIGVVGSAMIVGSLCYEYQDKKIPFAMAWFKYAAEPEGYNEKFKTTTYKNNKIMHTEEQEVAIDLVKAYIDETVNFSKGIFGDFNYSDISIKLDYDRSVFDKRSDSKDLAGYYMIEEKTMYMSVEDIYQDFISGGNFITDDATGQTVILNYKKTFMHEYAHHLTYEFLKANEIDAAKIPTWFNEGISNYIGERGRKNIHVSEIEEIKKFEDITTPKDWQEESGKEGNTVYMQAHMAIDMIVNENGKEAIKEIILKTKEMSFDEAFEKVMGKSLIKFENELREDIKNEYEKYFSYEVELYDDKSIEAEAKVLEEYISLNKKNAKAYINLYRIYIANEDKAIKILEEGVKQNNSDKELLQQLKTAYEYSEQFGKAKEIEKMINSI